VNSTNFVFCAFSDSPKFAPDFGGWHHTYGGKVAASGSGSERKRKAMHARVSIFEAENPEQVDGMLRQVRGQVLPQAKQTDGFNGLIALGDRQSGKTLGITLWESEEAMRASEEAANRMRSETAEASGEQMAGVERRSRPL
jgi:hypothetical protein